MKKYFEEKKEIGEELDKIKLILNEQWEDFRLEKTKEALELLEKASKKLRGEDK